MEQKKNVSVKITKKFVIKNIVIMVVLVIVLVAATFAWFSLSQTAHVSGIDTNIQDAASIEIMEFGGTEWKPDLEIDTEGLVTRELSGDGVDFYTPVYSNDKIVRFEYVNNENEESDVNDYGYIQKTFLIRSDATQDVYLDFDNSHIECVDEEGDTLTFKKGIVSGAIRVAFLEKTDAGLNLIYVWAPNSTYELSENTDGTFKTTFNGRVENSYMYQTGTDVNSFRLISTYNIGSNGIDSSNPDRYFVWGCPDSVKPLLLHFDNPTREEQVEKTVVMRVWLEGHDRECQKAVHGGKFKMNFKFNAE